MKTTQSGKVVKAVAALLLTANVTVFALPAIAAPVRLGGQQVINMNAAAGGLTAAQRADKIQQNLDNALVAANERGPSSVKVVYVKGQPVITLGGYYVVTVDPASAKAAATTPAILAERWAKSLRTTLSNKASVDAYVASLTGSSSSVGSVASNSPSSSTSSSSDSSSASSSSSSTPSYSASNDTTSASGSSAYSSNSPSSFHKGRVVYIPAGMTISAKLTTGLTSGAAKAGDPVEARISEAVHLGDASIPAGTILSGQVVEAKSGERMAKSGTISIKFNSLRTPDGAVTPISAHIVGGVAKYTGSTSAAADVLKGESLTDKVKRTAIAGAIGAGSGAVLGTTIGAIAGNGRGAGRGAWSGAAIGAGLGVAESLLLRKGAEVKLVQGSNITLQLDSPASIATSSSTY